MKAFPSVPDNAPGEAAAACFQQFNRKDGRVDVYYKPPKLQEALYKLFMHSKPKLTPHQAWVELRKMVDPVDQGLMFCYSKRGEYKTVAMSDPRYATWKCSKCGQKPCDCNGMLPTEEAIQSYFAALFQKQKKRETEEATTKRKR